MIENIYFEARNKEKQCVVKIHHASGDMTILFFNDATPLSMQDQYIKAIVFLDEKQQDVNPKNVLSVYSQWFTTNGMPTPIHAYVIQSDERKRIGSRIKEIRRESHVEAKTLSMLTGIDAANICRIEQGKYSVGLDVLSKMANAMGYRVDLVKI
jgi:DNA-binding XRE family transcriptional regulator